MFYDLRSVTLQFSKAFYCHQRRECLAEIQLWSGMISWKSWSSHSAFHFPVLYILHNKHWLMRYSFSFSWFLGSDARSGAGEAHDLGQAGEQEALLVLEGRHCQGAGGGALWLRGWGRGNGIVVSFGKTDQAFAGEQWIVISFQVPAAFWNLPIVWCNIVCLCFIWPLQMLDKSSIWWTLEWCCSSSTEMKFLLQTPHVNPASPMISVIRVSVTKSWVSEDDNFTREGIPGRFNFGQEWNDTSSYNTHSLCGSRGINRDSIWAQKRLSQVFWPVCINMWLLRRLCLPKPLAQKGHR